MGRKPTGKPTGRPEKEINWELFEQLCGIQCIQTEIASFLKVDHETLANRVNKQYGDTYSNIYKRYSESGKCSLRRHQFALSKKNATMAIWLGKQWLGQTDVVQQINMTEEGLKHFEELMRQIATSQSAAKSPSSNKMSEIRS